MNSLLHLHTIIWHGPLLKKIPWLVNVPNAFNNKLTLNQMLKGSCSGSSTFSLHLFHRLLASDDDFNKAFGLLLFEGQICRAFSILEQQIAFCNDMINSWMVLDCAAGILLLSSSSMGTIMNEIN